MFHPPWINTIPAWAIDKSEENLMRKKRRELTQAVKIRIISPNQKKRELMSSVTRPVLVFKASARYFAPSSWMLWNITKNVKNFKEFWWPKPEYYCLLHFDLDYMRENDGGIEFKEKRDKPKSNLDRFVELAKAVDNNLEPSIPIFFMAVELFLSK